MTRRTRRGSSTTRPGGPRHWLQRLHRRRTCDQCGRTSRLPECDVCGYELVRRTRAGAPRVPNV
jgi:hypothetical protein